MGFIMTPLRKSLATSGTTKLNHSVILVAPKIFKRLVCLGNGLVKFGESIFIKFGRLSASLSVLLQLFSIKGAYEIVLVVLLLDLFDALL